MQQSLGFYNLIKEISSGGMATVYLATNTQNNEKVAIKILHERLLSKEKIYERFQQEGFFKLDHPNIVKILDAGIHEQSPYIVMEYIEGQDLEEYIRQRGSLDIDNALSIFTQLLSALSYVHSKGIIHRDIKPKNILIDKNGAAKLTDFGIAKSLYSHIKTSTGGYLGAPAYSSPEQMDSKEVDVRSDIYSLGVTFYEMLSGHIPYTSASFDAIVKEKFSNTYIPITNYSAGIPKYIISIISKCIAKNPDNRFGSVGQIQAILNKQSASETVVKHPLTVTKKPVNKLAIMLGIFSFILIAILIIVTLSLNNKLPTSAPTTTIAAETTAADEIPIANLQVNSEGYAGEEIKLDASGSKDNDGTIKEYIWNFGDGTSYSGNKEIVTHVYEEGKYEVELTVVDNIGAMSKVSATIIITKRSIRVDKITFASERDGNPEIYIMNADGTDQTRLTNDPAMDSVPSFSPNGSKIAFTSERDGNPEIYIMNADGTDQTRLTDNSSYDEPFSFSPDGSKIAFMTDRDGNYEIYIMNADGTDQTRLTNDPAMDWIPSFSPDGSKIAFTSDRDGNYEIYIMNADGTDQARLTNDPAMDWIPSFSPDGSKIAFTSERDGNYEIYIMNADGTDQTRLTDDPAYDGIPSFSPDGSKIAFTSERDGNSDIYIMNTDGTDQTRLTDDPAYDGIPSFSFILEITAATETTAAAETTAATETTAAVETTAQTALEYGIGDIGPAGGYVFYVNPNYKADGWYYLEAAPEDQSSGIQWYNGDFIDTIATATAIGTGKTNTKKIIDIQGNGNYAASLCADLTISDYKDWFLPSIDELDLIYKNLYQKGKGSFGPNSYWSSSEVNETGALAQGFNYGDKFPLVKDYSSRVRAVRSF